MSTPRLEQIQNEPSLYVAQDTAAYRRNAEADATEVREFGELVAKHPEILLVVAPYISNAAKLGFERSLLAPLFKKLMWYDSTGRRLHDLLEIISRRFETRIVDASVSAVDLAGSIGAGLSERIVEVLLLEAGLRPDELRLDAAFYEGDPPDRINKRNADFFWQRQYSAGIYDCKNSPKSFLFSYKKRQWDGGEPEWLASKCYLMDSVAQKLRAGHRRVHCACITLQFRAAAGLLDMEIPQGMQVYCAEDLSEKFVEDVAAHL